MSMKRKCLDLEEANQLNSCLFDIFYATLSGIFDVVKANYQTLCMHINKHIKMLCADINGGN